MNIVSKLSLVLLSTVFSGSVLAATMTVTDSEISARLKHAFSSNSATASVQVKPSCNQGTVWLKGSVNSPEQAMALIELSESTPGVKDVNATALKIEGQNQGIAATDDIYITAKIKGIYTKAKVFGNQNFDATGITVETNDGAVTLNGQLKQSAQADQAQSGQYSQAKQEQQIKTAVQLASELKGVKSVESKLEFITE